MSNVDFKIYQNQNIIDNHQQFVHDCHLVHKKFKTTYPDIDSTWGYKLYNIFVNDVALRQVCRWDVGYVDVFILTTLF